MNIFSVKTLNTIFDATCIIPFCSFYLYSLHPLAEIEEDDHEEEVDMSLVADVVFDDDMDGDDEAARGNKVFDECYKIFNEAQVDSVSSSVQQVWRGSCGFHRHNLSFPYSFPHCFSFLPFSRVKRVHHHRHTTKQIPCLVLPWNPIYPLRGRNESLMVIWLDPGPNPIPMPANHLRLRFDQLSS